MCESPEKINNSDPDLIERFLLYMTKLIVSSENSPWKEAMLKGLLVGHLNKCSKYECLCEEIIIP